MQILKTRLVCLFVALSLSINYFYLIRPLALGRPNDSTNLWVFTAMSKSNSHLNQIYPVWRSRVAGMWITGQMFDSVVENGQVNQEKYQDTFALYQAVWLFLFFVILIFVVGDPLFMIVATFGCMLYMLTPRAAMYSYPWDIPALLFFTLNYFLWRQGRYAAMLPVMVIGYLFKETIILSGVLYFFADLSRMQKIRYLGATAVIAVIMKVLITLGVDGRISLFTNQVYGTEKPSFKDSTFMVNIRDLVTPRWNHFIFVNGGMFILSLFLPMRTRVERGTKAVLGLFSAASIIAGAFSEFRIMLDILPISIIALREYLSPKLSPLAVESCTLKTAKAAQPKPLPSGARRHG